MRGGDYAASRRIRSADGVRRGRNTKNGEEIAEKYAAENGVTVLLKGAAGNKSVITDGKIRF